MKKIILMFLLLLTSGCEFEKDKLDGAVVHTTIYPITYLVNYMYNDYSEISSIYPSDIDVVDYTLTTKQIDNFSQSDLFVYSGLTTEKNIAKEFVNNNGNILLIDATHSLAVINSVEELWLSPNNYLMLAKNIHDYLNEYLNNQYIEEHVSSKYNELSEILSLMDADLRQAGSKATENSNNTIVVSSSAFLFLENYGFKVINLADESNLTNDAINTISSNFDNERYLCLINEYGTSNEVINSFIKDGAKELTVDTYYSADNSNDYLNSMREFIFNLEVIINS